MTDTEYYDDTVADDEDDGLLDGDEDLGSLDPYPDTVYNIDVVSVTRSKFTTEQGDLAGVEQSRINVQLAINGGEFDGERSFHTFWMGPRGVARAPQHKRNRKSFNKFFQACTGEAIGKGSQVNIKDCEGATVSAKWVSAEYTNKDGELKNEGQFKWDDFSWAAPVEQDYEVDED